MTEEITVGEQGREEERAAEYPEFQAIVESGPEWALENLKLQEIQASREGSTERLTQYCRYNGVAALAGMLDELSPSRPAPESIFAYAARLAVAISSAHSNGPYAIGFPSHEEYENTVLRETPKRRYPLLCRTSGGMAETDVPPEVAESLNSGAAIFGNELLLFADSATLEELGDERPGKLLGELETIKETLNGLVFEIKLGSDRLKILRAFFRNS
jgi:hypothetical protein